jgi:precorrin-4 methylase
MGVVQRAYPPDTPVVVVLRAGYRRGEKVLRGKLDDIVSLMGREKEPWLGITFVGPCLH